MTFVDDFLPVAYELRALGDEFGLRTHRLFVVTTSERGTHTGDGDADETETEITESASSPPKGRLLSSEEIAVGGYPSRTVWEWGPITPPLPDGSGGTSLDLLGGSDMERRDTLQYEIRGPMYPNGARFKLLERRGDRAMGYKIRIGFLDQGSWA